MVFGVRKFIENYNSHQRLFFFILLSTDSKIKHNTAGFVLFTVAQVQHRTAIPSAGVA